jgi:cell shape-determining protein MreC
MDLTFTLIIVIAVLCLLLYGVVSKAIKNKKEIQNLTVNLERQEKLVTSLMKHLEEITQIKNDEKEISQKIQGAETDEEVENIIADIIARNNERVQNNKTK